MLVHKKRKIDPCKYLKPQIVKYPQKQTRTESLESEYCKFHGRVKKWCYKNNNLVEKYSWFPAKLKKGKEEVVTE